MPIWAWLILQGLASALVLRLVRRGVVTKLDAIAPLHSAPLVFDVWLPIALIAPLLGFILAVQRDVAGIGWVPLGGPPLLAVVGLGGVMLLSSRRDHRQAAASDEAVLLAKHASDAKELPAVGPWMWSVSAVVLLLLGPAHDLTIWIGQASLAIAAVTLWLLTPPLNLVRDRDAERPATGPLNVLALAVLLGLFAGFAGSRVVSGATDSAVSPAMRSTTVFLAMVVPLALLVMIARQAAEATAVRVSLWAGTFGVLLSVGLLSLRHLLPETLETLAEPVGTVNTDAAYGFHVYAFEAVGMFAAAIAAPLLLRWQGERKPLLGAVVLGGGVIALIWRLIWLS